MFIRNLKLKGYKKGFNWDIDMLSIACKKQTYILEVPVHFVPDTKNRKKSHKSIFSGLTCLIILVKNKFF